MLNKNNNNTFTITTNNKLIKHSPRPKISAAPQLRSLTTIIIIIIIIRIID